MISNSEPIVATEEGTLVKETPGDLQWKPHWLTVKVNPVDDEERKDPVLPAVMFYIVLGQVVNESD